MFVKLLILTYFFGALTQEEFNRLLSDPTQYIIVDDYGEMNFAPVAKKQELAQHGFRPATQKEIENLIDYKNFGEGLGNKIAAGTAGFFRVLTIGGLDYALEYFDDMAEQQAINAGSPADKYSTADVLHKLKEQNPDATKIGEVGIPIFILWIVLQYYMAKYLWMWLNKFFIKLMTIKPTILASWLIMTTISIVSFGLLPWFALKGTYSAYKNMIKLPDKINKNLTLDMNVNINKDK